MNPRLPRRIGIYLASVQFFFASSWVVYVLYLPRLAAEAGLPARAAPWLLLLDQLVFMVADFATGIATDRVARVFGRLGAWVLGITLVSCAVLLALPFVAPNGSPSVFIACTVLWAASSSALRAPPLKLIGMHAARPSRPGLIGLSLFGLGLANAIAPYLGLKLAAVDARVPFVVSSLALAAATWGIVAAERLLARGRVSPAGPAHPVAPAAPSAPAAANPAGPVEPSAPATPAMPAMRAMRAMPAMRATPATPATPAVPARGAWPVPATGALAALFAAAAFQAHVFFNSPALFLRHAAPADMPFLSPVFWVGFTLFLLPATAWTRHSGGARVMGTAALIAAIAATPAMQAPSLQLAINLQFLAGGAWACALMGATAGALVLGAGGAEGRYSGALASVLALAAAARLAMVTSGASADAAVQAVLPWAPGVLWLVAGLVLLTPWRRRVVPG